MREYFQYTHYLTVYGCPLRHCSQLHDLNEVSLTCFSWRCCKLLSTRWLVYVDGFKLLLKRQTKQYNLVVSEHPYIHGNIWFLFIEISFFTGSNSYNVQIWGRFSQFFDNYFLVIWRRPRQVKNILHLIHN